MLIIMRNAREAPSTRSHNNVRIPVLTLQVPQPLCCQGPRLRMKIGKENVGRRRTTWSAAEHSETACCRAGLAALQGSCGRAAISLTLCSANWLESQTSTMAANVPAMARELRRGLGPSPSVA